MKLILKQDVADLGDAGEVVDVARGYANNFLVPRGLAMPATDGAMADAAAISRARSRREAQNQAEAAERRNELEQRPVVIAANAGEDGTLYGSIGTTAIARAVRDQLGVAIDRRKIALERPLKELGEHTVPVRVYRETTADVRVVLARG